MSGDLAPVSAGRLNAEALLRELNTRTGSCLELLGMAALGESGGAAYVRWPDGHDGVLTHAHAPADELRRMADVLDSVRAHGIPVPHYELVAELTEGAAVVQERMPGTPATRIDRPAIDAMVELNERFAGLLADRHDVPLPELHLRESGPDFCRHETLERYSDRSRRLLGSIREIGDSGLGMMTGDDLLHLDFTPGNILFDESGRITGIVDWGDPFRGDRVFALVKLRFDLAWTASYADRDPDYTVDPAAVERLDELFDDTPDPSTLRVYWAHWSLKMVDFTIRHHSSDDVDLHLDLAGTRLS